MEQKEILDKLSCLIGLLGKNISQNDIIKTDSSLYYQIRKYIGGLTKAKHLLGIEVKLFHKPHYWETFSNLAKEIKKISFQKQFPTITRLRKLLGGAAYRSVLKFGGADKVAKQMKFKTNNLIASDGHHVKSSYEYIVDEVLYHNAIPHLVNGHIPGTNYRYDFKIADIYIEIWGFSPRGKIGEKYKQTRTIKEKIYKDKNLKLLSIEYVSLEQPYDDIIIFLKNLLQNITVVKTDVPATIINFCRHCHYWNIENTIKEIKALKNKLGHFPTTTEILRENPSLKYGVFVNGGINKLRILMHYPITRNTWNTESVILELKKIILETGDFPKAIDLKNTHKTGLLSAIDELGGLNYFRKLIGYPIIKPHTRKFHIKRKLQRVVG